MHSPRPPWQPLSRLLLAPLITILLFSAVCVHATSYTPLPRWRHTASRLGSRVYFIGGTTGRIDSPVFAPDIFYLDLSKAFPLTTLPFTQITPTTPLLISHHSACPSGGKIVVYGGRESPDTAYSVRVLDTDKPAWVNDATPFATLKRYEATCAVNEVSPSTGYLFGGLADSTTVDTLNTTFVFRDFAKLPSNAISFSHITDDQNRPDARWDHASVVLSDGRVIIMGGVVQTGPTTFVLAPMSEIRVFDPSANSWSVKSAGGAKIPLPRRAFAATSVGSRVIIYGGTDNNFVTPYDDLAVLDTTTWTWTVPEVKTPPAGRFGHTAQMVDSQNMLVAFGYSSNGADPRIYFMNVNTFEFLDAFTPIDTSLGAGAIIGIIIAVFVCLALIAFLVMFLRKRQKDRLARKISATSLSSGHASPAVPNDGNHNQQMSMPNPSYPVAIIGGGPTTRGSFYVPQQPMPHPPLQMEYIPDMAVSVADGSSGDRSAISTPSANGYLSHPTGLVMGEFGDSMAGMESLSPAYPSSDGFSTPMYLESRVSVAPQLVISGLGSSSRGFIVTPAASDAYLPHPAVDDAQRG